MEPLIIKILLVVFLVIPGHKPDPMVMEMESVEQCLEGVKLALNTKPDDLDVRGVAAGCQIVYEPGRSA